MREANGTRPGASGDADALAELIARARRILLFEQKTGHADSAVKPGGLESFIEHWTSELRATGQPEAGELAVMMTQRLANYHTLDPMRRTAQLRAALALLDGPPTERPTASAAPSTAKPSANAKPTATQGRATPAKPATSARAPRPAPSMRPATQAPALKEGEWPLAKPAPAPPDLRPQSMPRTQPRPEDAYLLDAPVTAVAGVGETQAARLARLGLQTVRDLLFNFPREHRDYSQLTKIGQAPFDEVITVIGMIWEVKTTRRSPRAVITTARVTDETGGVMASWFNQQYLQKQLTPGSYIVMTGVKKRFGNKVQFDVKSHELPEQGDLINTGRLTPVYPLTEGLNPKAMRKIAKWAVDHCAPYLNDHLPPEIRARAGLMALPEAVAQAHYPDNQNTLAAARKRLAFDEIFLVQLGMLTRRANWQDGSAAPAMPAPESLIFSHPETPDDVGAITIAPPQTGLWPLTASCFEPTLPFSFTGAQRRAIREILANIAGTKPMSRMLQGDVGSGKTVVAAAALLAAAANGYQGALLAPTEILAEQHYRGLSRLLAPFGLLAVLLTGSQKAKERAAARDALANGQAAVAIGTHALIQGDVDFHRLGLAIVDEQHRFGVEQRDALRRKGQSPHMLVMTATPIPRTLALTLYGDLDVSTLDEMPAGRKPIITRWRSGAQRQEAYKLVESEVAAGRQAYIICPLVEESEALEAKSAVAEYERLKTSVFPHLRLGLAHGQLKPAEKDRVMRQFRDGEIDILVATAVVEVGVDVPNATVMLIEDADRFGLSQAHQFRGRVGRGDDQSYCYLLTGDVSATAGERLHTLETTTDGFQLAEADLRLRGPGDFFGVRQSGMPELKMASMADTRLIGDARTQAEWLWSRDPYLKALEHAALRERVFLFWRNFNAH